LLVNAAINASICLGHDKLAAALESRQTAEERLAHFSNDSPLPEF
jgi:hypothetical protein